MSGPDATGAPSPTGLSHADIRSIFLGIMLAMLLSALDQTIVATAMPTIGRDLGQVELLTWVVTAYLLASTAVTPLYGKVSDMHGRRVTLLVGIGIFVLGSVICAMAPSMPVLIAGRAVQGLGGGGLIALAQTIVADMVTPRERGRYQVYFGAVFASASVGGPLLGGVLSESAHWSYIFWINLPLGALAFWLVNERLKKLPRHDRQHRLDVPGAVLMSGASVSLMLALSWGGARYPWASPQVIGTLLVSASLWLAFIVRLKVASEPLIPLSVLGDPVIALSILASALAMGSHIGLAIFVPIFFETALGFSARESGVALLPLMLSVVVGATASGRSMARRRHYKRVPTVGLAVGLLSIVTLAAEADRLPFWAVEICLGLMSFGAGTMFPVCTVALQNAVQVHHLGTATAAMNFSRQLTGAVIVAIFGAIVLAGGGDRPRVTAETLSGVGDPALLGTFRWVFAAAALGLACAFAAFAAMEERPFRGRAPAGEEG